MLKSVDIILGLSVVMFMVSLIVTVLTQAITNLLQTRGKKLLVGIASLLRQIHGDLQPTDSHQIAKAILTHPLIKSGTRYGTVIHREELTALLLAFAADDGPERLKPEVRASLCELLRANGIDNPARTLASVRNLVLLLERAHPELSNNERYAIAFLQEARSGFLSKINGWFDQTIDRVADRFTNSARMITFVGSLAVALVLQLDTAALVNRLSADPALRQMLVQRAVEVNSSSANQTASVRTSAGTPPLLPALSSQDQRNLSLLAKDDLLEIPTSASDWASRWTGDNWAMKLLGIVLTAMLLSLGAPFWYNALKNLIRLRSAIAQKDDDQRLSRQTNTADSGVGGVLIGSTATPLIQDAPVDLPTAG